MEAAQQTDKKAEREQNIAALEAEKASLQSDIINMREKVVQLEYEKSMRTLQGEIDALRTEKTTLEENAHAYEVEAQSAGANRPSPPTVQMPPTVVVNAGRVPTSPTNVEQPRPLQVSVPNRNPIQQRPSPTSGTPRPAVSAQNQAPKPKIIQ